MARRSKLTPAVQQRIVEAITLGATYELAAAAAGIAYETLNEWRKSKPQFSEALKAAEGEAVKNWLELIETAAKDGNWQAAAWKLERRYPATYGRQVKQIEHRGEIAIRITKRGQAGAEARPDEDERG